MKVLHIVGSIDKSAGGPSRSVPQTCEQLSKLGIEIELVSRLSAHPIEVNTSKPFKLSFRSLMELVLYGLSISKKEVSLIHLQHVWDPYIHVIAWFARIKGIPYLITPRGMLEPWIMRRNSWKKQLAMFLYQRRDLRKALCIHATCDMEKDNIRNLGFTQPIAVIPNGLNLSAIKETKVDFGTNKIVFLSRIHVKKGIEILLEAWKELNSKDWYLEIAGEGDSKYISELESSLKTENITNVKFVGSQYNSDKWSFIQSADLFVLPTYSENFGIVVAEALAVGVPVITTKGTPWQELETHRCGWWIDLTVPDLVKTLNKAINTSPEELKKMGLRGQKLVEDRYDIEIVAQNMKNLYEWNIGQANQPDFVYKFK